MSYPPLFAHLSHAIDSDSYHGGHDLAAYPEINIVRELFHSSTAHLNQDDRRSVLMPVQERLLKRAFRAFFEEDFTSALRELQTSDNAATKAVVGFALRLVDMGNTVQRFLRPHLRGLPVTSGTRDWQRSPIRCICWHPNTFKMAVSASDDSVRIYTDGTGVVPQLKCGQQKNISSMAWRPFSAGELAVGCHNGIILWSLHVHSPMARPINNSQLLKVGVHYPVNSVEWNASGSLLVSASPNDSDLIIWDVDFSRNVPLKRVGHPCSLVKWSPDESKLFSATVGGVFRVWDAEKWTPERWTVKCGTIQSVAWSPCSKHLLFVTTEDQLIYALKFANEELFTSAAVPKQALPVCDLKKLDGNDPVTGGRPQALAWDPTGKYLAVSYKDNEAITVFRTAANTANLTISLATTVKGDSGEFPTQICFQLNKLVNHEAVLTIGWSTGRIQYYPLS